MKMQDCVTILDLADKTLRDVTATGQQICNQMGSQLHMMCTLVFFCEIISP